MDACPRTLLDGRVPQTKPTGPADERRSAGPVTALWFLAIVVVVVAVGGVVLWLTSRSPSSTESSIDSFRREMDALSPKDRDEPRTGGG